MKKLMQAMQDNFNVQLFPNRCYKTDKRYFLQELNNGNCWYYEIYDGETGDSIFAGTDYNAACDLEKQMNNFRIK